MADIPKWLRRGQWVWSHERFAFFTLCCPNERQLSAGAICFSYPGRIHAYPGLLDAVSPDNTDAEIYKEIYKWIEAHGDMPTLDWRDLHPIPRDFFERKDNEDE